MASQSPAVLVPRSSPIKFYYSKRSEPMVRQALESANSGHAATCTSENNKEFEVGAFYEIDHPKLHPKSPIQLKAIRIVKVIETTRLDVTVGFPSMLALRNCFGSAPASDRSPELDERFVMSANQGEKILRRVISPSQLETERHLISFWLVSPDLPSDESPVTKEDEEEGESKDETYKGTWEMGSCLRALKSARVGGWGVRRRVKYIGRHRDLAIVPRNEGESFPPPLEITSRKRLRELPSRKKSKESRDRKRGQHKKKLRREYDSNDCRVMVKGSKERWSAERYASAELKLLEIMREKGAEIGNPILRQELREEARKHIGDTGLLDHLLKHMAGKVVVEGMERFRRRHNAEGAMEYWLEPAELMEIRRQAGVTDPYWIPPPGWKLGDAVTPCSCGAQCNLEIAHLKDVVAEIYRETKQLSMLKLLEKESEDDVQFLINNDDDQKKDKKVNYEILLEKNTKLEEEMVRLSSCVESLKEEIRKLKENTDKKVVEMGRETAEIMHDKNGSAEETTTGSAGGDKEEAEKIPDNEQSTVNSSSTSQCSKDGADAAANTKNNGKKLPQVRRSGFRICKPQGTFLWPDMGAGNAVAIGCRGTGAAPSPRPQVLVVPSKDRLLMFSSGNGLPPTPPSASSATSAPNMLLLPGPPTPPAAPSCPGAEILMVPPAPQLQSLMGLQQAEERTASSDNLCIPAAYCRMPMPRGSAAQSSLLGRGSGGEAKKRKMPVARMSSTSWGQAAAAAGGEKSSSAWSNVTTDLALATPSSNYHHLS